MSNSAHYNFPHVMGPGEMSKRYKAAEHSDGLQSCKVLVVSRSSDALQDFADL